MAYEWHYDVNSNQQDKKDQTQKQGQNNAL